MFLRLAELDNEKKQAIMERYLKYRGDMVP